MRTLCASTLIGEFLVVGLAGLVALRLTDHSPGTVWLVFGTAMALCLLACGLLGRPGGVAFGWVVQAGLIASGFLVPTMFVLGAVFALLWWTSVHYGRKIDAGRAAAQP
ncbi:DUF4233 domain-containing protein [Streptomyces sp. JJ66]|uniref:DUF4233 domain-containing protein n=1 Tax=Streptomyces sp. JJ66 TaxID=2803843 RepID=UPI001C57FD2F|nr:DUF4233 domain-containing protein [Streptomyces sp. JJ66]MBW1601094.1 DUF4233 domain-containing protein [Streptomyces sp. JJ66]